MHIVECHPTHFLNNANQHIKLHQIIKNTAMETLVLNADQPFLVFNMYMCATNFDHCFDRAWAENAYIFMLVLNQNRNFLYVSI